MFKGHKLCIPEGLVWENVIIELHSGGLGGHFGMEKTKALVEGKILLANIGKIYEEMEIALQNLATCQGVKSNYRSLYTIACTIGSMGTY